MMSERKAFSLRHTRSWIAGQFIIGLTRNPPSRLQLLAMLRLNFAKISHSWKSGEHSFELANILSSGGRDTRPNVRKPHRLPQDPKDFASRTLREEQIGGMDSTQQSSQSDVSGYRSSPNRSRHGGGNGKGSGGQRGGDRGSNRGDGGGQLGGRQHSDGGGRGQPGGAPSWPGSSPSQMIAFDSPMRYRGNARAAAKLSAHNLSAERRSGGDFDGERLDGDFGGKRRGGGVRMVKSLPSLRSPSMTGLNPNANSSAVRRTEPSARRRNRGRSGRNMLPNPRAQHFGSAVRP